MNEQDNNFIDHILGLKLNAPELKVLLLIFRKTYGFHKDSDMISLSQFIEQTNLAKSGVVKAIKNLVDMDLILIDKDTYINSYSINKEVLGHIKLVLNSVPTIHSLTKYNNIYVPLSTTERKAEDVPKLLKGSKTMAIKKQYRPRVWMTEPEYLELCKKHKPVLIEKALSILNNWKEEKNATAGNDYLSLKKWVIDKALKESSTSSTGSNLLTGELNLEDF